jgi:hypothetical protein
VSLEGATGATNQERELTGQMLRMRAALEQAQTGDIHPSPAIAGVGHVPIDDRFPTLTYPQPRKPVLTGPMLGLILVVGVMVVVTITMIISTSATKHALDRLAPQQSFQQVQQALQQASSSISYP